MEFQNQRYRNSSSNKMINRVQTKFENNRKWVQSFILLYYGPDNVQNIMSSGHGHGQKVSGKSWIRTIMDGAKTLSTQSSSVHNLHILFLLMGYFYRFLSCLISFHLPIISIFNLLFKWGVIYFFHATTFSLPNIYTIL